MPLSLRDLPAMSYAESVSFTRRYFAHAQAVDRTSDIHFSTRSQKNFDVAGDQERRLPRTSLDDPPVPR